MTLSRMTLLVPAGLLTTRRASAGLVSMFRDGVDHKEGPRNGFRRERKASIAGPVDDPAHRCRLIAVDISLSCTASKPMRLNARWARVRARSGSPADSVMATHTRASMAQTPHLAPADECAPHPAGAAAKARPGRNGGLRSRAWAAEIPAPRPWHSMCINPAMCLRPQLHLQHTHKRMHG